MKRKTITLDLEDWFNICNWCSTHKDRYDEEMENDPEYIDEYTKVEKSITKLTKKVFLS